MGEKMIVAARLPKVLRGAIMNPGEKHMKRKMIGAVLALLMTSASISIAKTADTREEQCRKLETEYFDLLMTKTCPDNLAHGGRGISAMCSDILTMRDYFVPTKRIPDLAAFRMMWIEYRTEICMRTPQAN